MSRIVRHVALLALSVSGWCVNAAPARVLFPSALHLTREVHDPVSGTTTTIDEYCSGNRVVSISADRTVIADYGRQEITEIDRRAGTYSISRFDEMAGASREAAALAGSGDRGNTQTIRRETWKPTPLGTRRSSHGRAVEQFELTATDGKGRKVDVGVDRSVALSRDAVEVLIGAAYPNPRRDEHEALLLAAGASNSSDLLTNQSNPSIERVYGLPVTQSFRYAESGVEIAFRTEIIRVGTEAPPPELLIIPPAAQRVESRAAAVRRELRDLDHPSSSRQQP